jgi:metal transporter CNNM
VKLAKPSASMAVGRRGTALTSPAGSNLLAARSTTVGLARLLFTCLSTVSATPLGLRSLTTSDHEEPEAEGTNKLVLLLVSMALVLLGGAFAGLTIA